MEGRGIYPRLVEPRLLEALDDSPAVLVHGPRQSGKTTLVQMVGEPRGYVYISFDDQAVLAAAKEDPVGFVDNLPNRAILDEAQRVPELFSSLKRAIDQNPGMGRFLLTGSANLLFVPRLSDSLAGRMSILRLHPLAQLELEQSNLNFLDQVFAAGPRPAGVKRLRGELVERICAGGFPAALRRKSWGRRLAWYRDYVETLVQRDVRDLSRIRSLDVLPRLLRAAAAETARMMDVSKLAAPFTVSRPTIREYLTLLSRLFLVEELPAWHNNLLKRVIKQPKLHMGDTGLACAMLGLDPHRLEENRTLLGQMLETFVYQELRRQASGWVNDARFYHFRTKDKEEVDIVIESGSRIAGFEVKAAATVRSPDFRGLRKLQRVAGKRFLRGLLLYDGENVLPFGENLYALPIRMLWETR